MLKKKERLTKKQFDIVFKTGKRAHGQYLQLIYKPDDEFHAAVVVGKKVYKKAVLRNRLRRQLYAYIYQVNKNTPLSGTFIVVAKQTAKIVGVAELKTELLSLLKKVSDVVKTLTKS